VKVDQFCQVEYVLAFFFLYLNMGPSKRISPMATQLSDTPMMLQRKIDFTLELPLIKFERAHPPYMGCINYDSV
jgi:hypothetical protein